VAVDAVAFVVLSAPVALVVVVPAPAEVVAGVLGETVTVFVVVPAQAVIASATRTMTAPTGMRTAMFFIGVVFARCSGRSSSPGAARASIKGAAMTDEPAKPRGRIEPGLLERARGIIVTLERRDPIWGPGVIVAGAILLDVALPEKLTLGPNWLLPGLEAILLLGLLVTAPHPRMRHSPLRRRIAILLIGLVSLTNLVSLYLLAHYLLHHGSTPKEGRPLILAGVVLWVTNVLLFGLWYWELDRGGPVARVVNPKATPDFLFPQMTLPPQFAPRNWSPGLIDYLYVSFTNATAFSPTDTMPLTATAKLLMSTQALASLLTIGLVVARAVNILQ